MNIFSTVTSAMLREASDIKEQIIKLEERLASMLGGTFTPTPKPARKHKMSAAGRAKIAAAQKARWAKKKGTKPGPAIKKKRKMSAAGRAAIAAAAKARWATARLAGKNSL